MSSFRGLILIEIRRTSVPRESEKNQLRTNDGVVWPGLLFRQGAR